MRRIIMADGSVTGWLEGLRRGDPADAQRVWERYFARLAERARRHLRRSGRPGAEADEEDVALSAFDSFFRGAEQGRFPRLEDRADLWQVLVMIAARKAATLAERRGRKKRGAGRVVGEVDLAGVDGSAIGLDGVADPRPSPEFAAMAVEECRRLLDALGDGTLREVALLKLAGYSHEEIRDELNCSLRTVTNKVELIRRTWTEGGAG